MSPQFQHDCKACHFVGKADGKDAYYCESGHCPSLVLRDGNEPANNQSVPVELAAKTRSVMTEALCLAIMAGWVHNDVHAPAFTVPSTVEGNWFADWIAINYPVWIIRRGTRHIGFWPNLMAERDAASRIDMLYGAFDTGISCQMRR